MKISGAIIKADEFTIYKTPKLSQAKRKAGGGQKGDQVAPGEDTQ